MTHRSPGRTLVLLLALMPVACATKWQAQTAPPAEVLKFNGAGDYLITPTHGMQFELRNPVLERDSLIGIEKADPTGPDLKVRRAIALSDIEQVAIREPDGVATAIWVSVIGTFAALIAIGAAFAAGMSD